ncbi:MAG: hypothetical protein A3J38_09550 [Gammaproteobacteria bacterium RIFCSPHIGHO2_12_FULL_45_9]|nr:MAG: hypothetical protein A3J38_09550 [Gammaproteobacteria bacterium RIFCSPHIGHO2_12_FULL_45_9]
MQPFAIGNDNFGEIRTQNARFIDKSLFIKEIFDHFTTKVSLITRPRRFGKTLNLSMLHHFLSTEIVGLETRALFNDLKITEYPEIMAHQGKYPVIFLTLKGIKATSFDVALSDFSGIMRDTYKAHDYLRSGPQFTTADQLAFDRVIQLQCQVGELHTGLAQLCRWLRAYHGVNPWVLIDEYDTPIQAAYLNDYYREMVGLLQPVLGNTFKTNPYLERAVLTGITRVSKESLFSDLNNVAVYTLFKNDYSTHFGFTEPEMDALLVEAELTHCSAEIKRWYNGYLCGDTVLYNPWSIINCVTEKGNLEPYWVNTGGTSMIQQLLAQADPDVKIHLETLLQGHSIIARINDHLVYGLFGADVDSVMSLLLSAGYLKALSRTRTEMGEWLCELTIPNYEVMTVYRLSIMLWLVSQGQQARYEGVLKALVQGDMRVFSNELAVLLERVLSYFDPSGQEPEKFYHGLVLGLVVHLAKTHTVESNRESGWGRYDVMIIPHDVSQIGIVMEFKVAFEHEMLKEIAESALTQIKSQHYAAALTHRQIHKILAIGLAFRGKKVCVQYEWVAGSSQ